VAANAIPSAEIAIVVATILSPPGADKISVAAILIPAGEIPIVVAENLSPPSAD
jgi:hypothetical protein